jgi:hypothetical protein
MNMSSTGEECTVSPTDADEDDAESQGPCDRAKPPEPFANQEAIHPVGRAPLGCVRAPPTLDLIIRDTEERIDAHASHAVRERSGCGDVLERARSRDAAAEPTRSSGQSGVCGASQKAGRGKERCPLQHPPGRHVGRGNGIRLRRSQQQKLRDGLRERFSKRPGPCEKP